MSRDLLLFCHRPGKAVWPGGRGGVDLRQVGSVVSPQADLQGGGGLSVPYLWQVLGHYPCRVGGGEGAEQLGRKSCPKVSPRGGAVGE
jgi:hypothetical protein